MRGLVKRSGGSGGTDWRAERVFIAEMFHWTLEYVDGLSWEDLCDVREVLSARNQAESDKANAFRK